MEELIHGGAYFRNFTVPSPLSSSLIDDTLFFYLILAVIFSRSIESAVFMSCNLFASFACFSDLNILIFTSGNRILSFLLFYFIKKIQRKLMFNECLEIR